MNDPSLRRQAYQTIKDQIVSGNLPAGTRISEQRLAAELGSSRTPIRSAIRALEAEGLLEQVPRYGTIVKATERRDLEELYELRMAVEGYAAEAAAARITSEDLGLLGSLCDRMRAELRGLRKQNVELLSGAELARFVEADQQFHMVILRATGNSRIMKSVSDARQLCHWGHTIPHSPQMVQNYWSDHRKVLQALMDADPAAARLAMVEHIRGVCEASLIIYDRLRAEGVSQALLRRPEG